LRLETRAIRNFVQGGGLAMAWCPKIVDEFLDAMSVNDDMFDARAPWRIGKFECAQERGNVD